MLLIVLASFLFGDVMKIYPKKECALFNNLKHTKNRGHVVLKLDKPYEMLRHHKGQYLVKVEGATPPQRWVDDDCLSLRPLRGTPMYEKMHAVPTHSKPQKSIDIDEELALAEKHMARKTQKNNTQSKVMSKQNLLALSWHNAFCETHRYKKECKRGLSDLIGKRSSDTHFVLHGLWPQPRNKEYCHLSPASIRADKSKHWRAIPNVNLSKKTISALSEVMPGVKSALHKHEWAKHGSCYGTDADRYFSDAVSLVQQVNEGVLGRFFSQNIGKRITLKELQIIANKAYGRGAGSRIALQCKKGMVTEMWLNLGGTGTDLKTLLTHGKPAHSRCKGGRVDRAGFGR